MELICDMTEDLYTPADTKRVRELFLKEQEGLDLITNLEIPPKQACLDHLHDDEQLVRGVLHRQINAALGKLEGVWTRYLSYWYPYDLPTFLEQSAKYLRLPSDTRYRHPDWTKKIKTKFNTLNSKQQDLVLQELGSEKGKNLKERKELFAKLVLNRNLGYDIIRSVINKVKES